MKRFQCGETLAQIALTQPSGNPIQPSTVLGHLLTALTHGRHLNLSELQEQAVAAGCSPPSRDEWALLDSAPIDVVRTEKVVYAELLSSFLPEGVKPRHSAQ